METGDSGLAVPALDAERLAAAATGIDRGISLTVGTWKQVPSPWLRPQDILDLAHEIEALSADYDGVVISHGTDTLEETAYFLDLIVAPRIATVVTGAQRHHSVVGGDGPRNLKDAVITAADDESSGAGALVVFCSQIHAARDVIKTHTQHLDAFKSLEAGPLGAVEEDRVIWLRKPVILEKYPVTRLDSRVEVVFTCMGSDSSLLEAVLATRPDGVVIQGLGGGHVPPAMIPGIRRVLDSGAPVILTSRCFAGRLLHRTYGYEGSETHLHDMGVIFADGLSTTKARVKLITLLGAGYDIGRIRESFECQRPLHKS